MSTNQKNQPMTELQVKQIADELYLLVERLKAYAELTGMPVSPLIHSLNTHFKSILNKRQF